MIFQVFHAKEPNFRDDKLIEFNDDNFVLVAKVECDRHQMTFKYTNHIDRAWWENPEVKWHKPQSRSTSVGDVVVDADGNRFRVMGMGWQEF